MDLQRAKEFQSNSELLAAIGFEWMETDQVFRRYGEVIYFRQMQGRSVEGFATWLDSTNLLNCEAKGIKPLTPKKELS